MGNFEKLSVLVIVVIIVMILVVAIHTWSHNPEQSATTGESPKTSSMTDGVDPVAPDAVTTGGVDGTGGDPHDWHKIFPDERDDKLEPILSVKDEPIDPNPVKDPADAPAEDPTATPVKDVPGRDAPAEAGEPYMYTVKSGDTFSEIVMRECGSIRHQSKVAALNPGLDVNSLRVGQQIKLPAKGGLLSTNPPKVSADGTDLTPAGGAGSPTPGEYYITRPGDTLEKISKRAYRKFDYWGEIWARNLSVLESPEEIRAGMKLFIPKVKAFK